MDLAGALATVKALLPQDPLLWAEMGRTMLRLGMVDEALKELQVSHRHWH